MPRRRCRCRFAPRSSLGRWLQSEGQTNGSVTLICLSGLKARHHSTAVSGGVESFAKSNSDVSRASRELAGCQRGGEHRVRAWGLKNSNGKSFCARVALVPAARSSRVSSRSYTSGGQRVLIVRSPSRFRLAACLGDEWVDDCGAADPLFNGGGSYTADMAGDPSVLVSGRAHPTCQVAAHNKCNE